MFGIGGGEILVIALVALLLFGNEDLPKNMRKMVKAWNDFRGVTTDLQRSWFHVREQVARDLLTEQTPPPAATSPAESTDSPLPESTEPGAAEKLSAAEPPPESLHESPLGLPLVQRAEGALAQGDVDDNQQVSPQAASDKST